MIDRHDTTAQEDSLRRTVECCAEEARLANWPVERFMTQMRHIFRASPLTFQRDAFDPLYACGDHERLVTQLVDCGLSRYFAEPKRTVEKKLPA